MFEKASKFVIGALAPALMLGGCAAASDKYPSLAIRDFEREVAPEQVTPLPMQAMAPALVEKVAGARALALREDAAFRAALPAVERQVASTRGLSATSNAWAAAQVALSQLQTRRNLTVSALGDIDEVIAAQSAQLVDTSAQQSIQQEVEAILSSQDRALAQLRGL